MLIIPAPEERTDYLCEMKFSESPYYITAADERKLLNKQGAFKVSKKHKPSHSLLMIMLTSMGLGESMHNGIVNATVSPEDLFMVR